MSFQRSQNTLPESHYGFNHFPFNCCLKCPLYEAVETGASYMLEYGHQPLRRAGRNPILHRGFAFFPRCKVPLT